MKYTIVIVEDELIELQELSMIIKEETTNLELVGTANNGIDGQKLIDELTPDIVISDIRLPGQSGLDMLSKINTPVKTIILSGYSDFDFMQKAIRLGVDDYLLKPVDNDVLFQAINKIIDQLAKENVTKKDMVQIPLVESVSNHLINNAIKFVEQNYSHQVGLQEAADFLNVSETHLSRLFKELVGITFLTYLNTYRINKSVDLLLHSNKHINEIALECGYITPGYYAKIFKRLLNTTPTNFRDNQVR